MLHSHVARFGTRHPIDLFRKQLMSAEQREFVWCRVRSPRGSSRPGVTLSEVLTVLAIVCFMLALLVPSLQKAKEQARRIQCANNLRQWGIATRLYRDDWSDHLPTEGTYLSPDKPFTWFNVLPPYLDAPPYREVEGVGEFIREFPALHVWICPSKNISRLNTSGTGQNQFHYGMNQVLDGVGIPPNGSSITPGFPDQGERPIRATPFKQPSKTVFMFDIFRNDSRGYQRDVATLFHRGIGNVLFLDGGVAAFESQEFVTGGDFARGDVIWNHPNLYWGYARAGR